MVSLIRDYRKGYCYYYYNYYHHHHHHHHHGICKLACLVNDLGNNFLSLKAFVQKFKIKCNFLRYRSLLSAIPDQWKKKSIKRDEQRNKSLKRDAHQHALTSTQLAIDKLTCKTVYNTLISRQQCPPTAEKRLIECAFDEQKRQRVYSLPFRVTKEVKLSIFQYKIIHNILYTNNI